MCALVEKGVNSYPVIEEEIYDCNCCSNQKFAYIMRDPKLRKITRKYNLKITLHEKEFTFKDRVIKCEIEIIDDYSIGRFLTDNFDEELKEECRNRVKKIYDDHIIDIANINKKKKKK